MSLILSDYTREEIIAAAKRVIKLVLDWDEEPYKILIDEYCVYLEYDTPIGDSIAGFRQFEDGSLIFSRGKEKKFGYIEIDRSTGLKHFMRRSK